MKRKDFPLLSHDSQEWEFIRYFKPSEFEDSRTGQLKIALALVSKLDQMRHILNRPLVITSGYRSHRTNELVGGSPNSSHLYGLAVDIKVSNSQERYELIKLAFEFGFRRIGIADTFVHLDIDPEKPQDLIWTYNFK